MWDYTHEAPKGERYGIRTYKVIGAPDNEKQLQIIVNDPNAWVGLHTQVLTKEAAKPAYSAFEKKLRDESPYGQPLFASDDPDLIAARNRRVSSVPQGYSPMKTVDLMGFKAVVGLSKEEASVLGVAGQFQKFYRTT